MNATAAEREDRCRMLLPLVQRLARGMWRVYRLGDEADFVQDGYLGMIRAVDAYDSARGVPLEAYARPLIAGAILNGVRTRDPLSEGARRALRTANRERAAMAREQREVPTMQEMARRISGLGAAILMAHQAYALSLDEPLPEGESLPVDWSGDPARVVELRERRHELRQAIARLTDRQRAVVREHYYGAKTISQVGRALEISPQRVTQLHSSAIAHMRKALAKA